jgi:Protein of unknown function (DUF2637)
MNEQSTVSASHPADVQRALRSLAFAAVIIGVLVLAAAAFVLSYSGIHAIALAAGVSPALARLYPVIFDAMLIIAAAAVLSLRTASVATRCYAWLCMLLLLFAAAGADALHATGNSLPHQVAAATVAIIPWALVLLGFGLLLVMLRHARLHRVRPAQARADAVPRTAAPPTAALAVPVPAAAAPLTAAPPALTAAPPAAAPPTAALPTAAPPVPVPAAAAPPAAAPPATAPSTAAPPVPVPAAVAPLTAAPPAATPATAAPPVPMPAAAARPTEAPTTAGPPAGESKQGARQADPSTGRNGSADSVPHGLDALFSRDSAPVPAAAATVTASRPGAPEPSATPGADHSDKIGDSQETELALDAEPGNDDPTSDEAHSASHPTARLVPRAGEEKQPDADGSHVRDDPAPIVAPAAADGSTSGQQAVPEPEREPAATLQRGDESEPASKAEPEPEQQPEPGQQSEPLPTPAAPFERMWSSPTPPVG